MKSSRIYILLLVLIFGIKANEVFIEKGETKYVAFSDITGPELIVVIDAGKPSGYAFPAEFQMLVGEAKFNIKICQDSATLKICVIERDKTKCADLKNSPALVIKDGVVELQKESAFSEVIYTRTSGEIDFYSNGDKKTVTIGLSEDAPTNFKLIALNAYESQMFNLKRDVLLNPWFPYVVGGVFAIMLLLNVLSSCSCFCCGRASKPTKRVVVPPKSREANMSTEA